MHCYTGEAAKGWGWDGRCEGTSATCVAAYNNMCKTVPKFENCYSSEFALKEMDGA